MAAARRGNALEVARYLGWLAVGVMSALVTPYGTGILDYYRPFSAIRISATSGSGSTHRSEDRPSPP